ncbi:uncharacterized protein LOC133187237 [Saccostrea echinata]|uniref:uncharacterized protein LOC133187237 n=1 Tax=Saccostrea echinata TaxID=191078 RepID=UPI002A7ECB55|nr:uncharacterized protein LOC133187237 [Saccostrea echinata]
MASGKGAGKGYQEKGRGYMYWFAFICSIISLVLVFVAFASPFWYKSWSRVHSPLANVGMWHICLSGWVKPRDPTMRSYVGCWWIHSTFFEEVWDDIMPAWFRIVQTIVILTLLINMAAVLMLSFYPVDRLRIKYYNPNRYRAFLVNSVLMFVSAVFVLIVALLFPMKARDPNWMPRPWLNYLSWSYGFFVLSGFFAVFAGISLFIKSSDIHHKPEKGTEEIEKKLELPPLPSGMAPPIRPPHYEPSEHGRSVGGYSMGGASMGGASMGGASMGAVSQGAQSKHSESFV